MSAETELFERMRFLDTTEKLSYAERGAICLRVEQEMLHNERINPQTGKPCTLTQWVNLSSPWSSSTCFAALRDVKELKDVPAKDLASIPPSNFPILKQLSTAVRARPEVIQAAQSQCTADFARQIQRDHPEQHIEVSAPLRFVADQTQTAEINEAIDAFIKENGSMNRTAALAGICVDYMAGLVLRNLEREVK